jgi:hypothetical protein
VGGFVAPVADGNSENPGFLEHGESMTDGGGFGDWIATARRETKDFDDVASEEAFLWVLTAPLLLFKDSMLFSTESDNLITNPTII